MHPLLARQMRRHLPPDWAGEPVLQVFLDSVGRYYEEADQERRLLESAMTVSSQELSENIAKARSEHGLLRSVMDSIPDLIFFKSLSGEYLGCNKAYERYMRVQESEVLGKTDFDVLGEPLASELLAQDQEVLSSGRRQLTERWFDSWGKRPRVCMEVLRTPYYDADGQLLGLIGIGRDITERKLSDETIQWQANYDALTELPNRRYFHERLEHEMKLAKRSGHPLVLMLIDLDNFKQVNDLLGHFAGDQLLVQVAHRITACVRDTDMVARLGGDEFIVALPGNLHLQQIETVACKLLESLATSFQLGEEMAVISGSIGITIYPENGDDAQTLLKNADQAMYFAKASGRNRYSLFTPVLQETATKRRQLMRDLPAAVEAQQFQVHYQPIVDLQTGAVHKAEALVRWLHPVLGFISPADFIPLAEDTGAILDIGDFVFRASADLVQHLRAQGYAGFQISVNKSPVQFRGPRNQVAEWVEHLAGMGLPGDAVAFEITENLLMQLEEGTRSRLLAMRDVGMQISLDDFGTGYSSLSYLKSLDIDFLKIDQSFVRDLEEDPSDRALCEAIIVMAHKLGLQVVAEGIETNFQRQFLQDAGCDYGQGYLFSRPVPGPALQAFLQQL